MIDSKVLNINYLTKEKENQYFDRKSAAKKPKDILKHLVAFANAGGGHLVIGIEDDGKITGFKSGHAYNIEDFKTIPSKLVQTPISFKTKELDVINTFGIEDKVLIISVDVSSGKVIQSIDNEAYLRQKDESVKLTFEQRLQLAYDKGQLSFEDEILDNSSINDVDMDLVEKYKELLEITHLTNVEVLNARNLINDEGKLTKAGALLFSKNPTKFLIQARVKVLKIDGNELHTGEKFNVIKEKTFDSPIPKAIVEIKEFINTQLRDFQNLTKEGKFQQMPEYPEFAWFEGIVNSLTHRNYSISGEYIKVLLFDNRMEIHSPGLLPNIVTLENILEKRYSRNPRIARVLSEFGWVKEMNEGVKRIYSEMENYFLKKPTYSEPNNSVLLVLENNIIHRIIRTSDKITKLFTKEIFNGLSVEEEGILQYIYTHGQITPKEAEVFLSRSRVYVNKILKKLVDAELIVLHGNPRDPKKYYKFNVI